MAANPGFFSEQQYDYLYKVTLYGTSGSGKSNLISRFTRNEFSLETKSTIGVEYASKKVQIGNQTIQLQLWDTCGQERYRAIKNCMYRGSVGYVLVYNIANSRSFKELEVLLHEINDNKSDTALVFLLGTKSDLKHLREIYDPKPQEWARKNGVIFLGEASALDSYNVDKLFSAVAGEIFCQSGLNSMIKDITPSEEELEKKKKVLKGLYNKIKTECDFYIQVKAPLANIGGTAPQDRYDAILAISEAYDTFCETYSQPNSATTFIQKLQEIREPIKEKHGKSSKLAEWGITESGVVRAINNILDYCKKENIGLTSENSSQGKVEPSKPQTQVHTFSPKHSF